MYLIEHEQQLPQAPPVLIAGAHGTLGRAFARLCHLRGLAAVALGRAELNITDPVSVEAALEQYQPWAVVNAAGYVRVDDAETDAARCHLENAGGPAVLAAACAARQLPLLTFSSDLVFDGRQAAPYVESACPNPLNVYGQSKLAAEQAVLAAHPAALVVRTSAFFGPWDEYNFVHHVLQAARHGRSFEAAADTWIAPTYVPDLVNTSLDLLIDQENGLWHVANQTPCTWAELARTAAKAAGYDPSFVVPRPMESFGLPAARPHYSVLGTERGVVLPSLPDALRRYLLDVPDAVNPMGEEAMAAS